MNGVLTEEEVLLYGKRIFLFERPKTREREIYYVENDRVYRYGLLINNGVKFEINYKMSLIEEIYPYIERVYAQKTKGVLIAQRSGNWSSNQLQQMPLRKTGKGIPKTTPNKEKLKKMQDQMELYHKKVAESRRERLNS